MTVLHSLGFHGQNWHPIMWFGNIWAECSVCGARRMVPFGDYADIPKGTVIPDRTTPLDAAKHD